MASDKQLVCTDCGKEFTWTATEQEEYARKGFENEPKRCLGCRRSRREEKKKNQPNFEIVCADCGKKAFVPFEPKGNRPIYCQECFEKRRQKIKKS